MRTADRNLGVLKKELDCSSERVIELEGQASQEREEKLELERALRRLQKQSVSVAEF